MKNGPRYEPTIITQDRIEESFKHHDLQHEQIERCNEIRIRSGNLAKFLHANCPPSRELSLATTKLEEVAMWANKAIACNETAD